MELVRHAPKNLNFTAALPPVIPSPVSITWDTRIMSTPQFPAMLYTTGDVIDSFNVNLIVGVVAAMFVICSILLAFSNAHYKFEKKCSRKVFWTVFRSLLYQADYDFKKSSFVVLQLLFYLE